MKSFFLSLIFILITVSSANSQSTHRQVRLLDHYITDAIKQWNPPGLAVTVVKDGDIIFAKGYGVKTLGSANNVDENTLFVCASTTKAFIATAMAMLVDDGKLNWSDKVIDHLPTFQLQDPYITRELTIKDLLTHRSGIGNTDYLWSLMTISSDSALYKMREVKASYSLRSSFVYQNLMYLAAGKVIESVSGMTWEQFLQDRIYTPLKMEDTYALYKRVKQIENKADAHYNIDEEITKIDQMVVDNMGPAGSMWSSINDMGKWIKFLLDNGIHNGDTLIKSTTFRELFKPQQIIPESQFYPTQKVTKPNWRTYGLGWFQHDYRGKMVQFHTGSLAGMVAIAGMIPEENIGVYVMGNLDHVELRHAIMYTTFDLFMDGKITRDWSTELYALYHPEKETTKEPKPIENTKPSLTEANILGSYSHDIFGEVEISKNGEHLVLNLNNTVYGRLKHWHYDTYQVAFKKKEWRKTKLTFRMGANGKISHLNIFGEQFNYRIEED